MRPNLNDFGIKESSVFVVTACLFRTQSQRFFTTDTISHFRLVCELKPLDENEKSKFHKNLNVLVSFFFDLRLVFD